MAVPPVILRYHVPPGPGIVAPVLVNIGVSSQPTKDRRLVQGSGLPVCSEIRIEYFLSCCCSYLSVLVGIRIALCKADHVLFQGKSGNPYPAPRIIQN